MKTGPLTNCSDGGSSQSQYKGELIMKTYELLEIKVLVDTKVIFETCSRIGIANKKKKILYPSCYLYEQDGKFYLAHFKQMFLLTRDSAYNSVCEDDILRRNAIAFCLRQWGLIDVSEDAITPHNRYVFVLPHNQKHEWRISHKFNFRGLDKSNSEYINTNNKESLNV